MRIIAHFALKKEGKTMSNRRIQPVSIFYREDLYVRWCEACLPAKAGAHSVRLHGGAV